MLTVNDFLKDNPDACEPAVSWLRNGNYITMREAWQDCKRSDWMLWSLNRKRFNDHKILRLLACAFVRRTPLADGRFVWDLLTDERSKQAVITAEAYALGQATDEDLRSARRAAAYAAYADYAAYAAYAAYAVADAVAYAAYAADAVADAATYADAYAAAAKAVQANIIREYIPQFPL